eukprot:scaffold103886_cov39-Prasinocladus_malaysianus.AAC.1
MIIVVSEGSAGRAVGATRTSDIEWRKLKQSLVSPGIDTRSGYTPILRAAASCFNRNDTPFSLKPLEIYGNVSATSYGHSMDIRNPHRCVEICTTHITIPVTRPAGIFISREAIALATSTSTSSDYYYEY